MSECSDEKRICEIMFVHRDDCDGTKKSCQSDWEKAFAKAQEEREKRIALTEKMIELKMQTIAGQLADLRHAADERDRQHIENNLIFSKRLDAVNDKIDAGFQKLLYQMLGMMLSGISIGIAAVTLINRIGIH